jgi:diacylglycerol diphosphate phosphatase/phosphatidate phosphatase
MRVLRPQSDLSRFFFVLAPLLGAALISISRVEDYRHGAFDVAIGSILGICIALFSYRRYYPSLCSIHCDKPFPSRADVFANNLALYRRDEESGGAEELGDLDEQTPLTDTSRRNLG